MSSLSYTVRIPGKQTPVEMEFAKLKNACADGIPWKMTAIGAGRPVTMNGIRTRTNRMQSQRPIMKLAWMLAVLAIMSSLSTAADLEKHGAGAKGSQDPYESLKGVTTFAIGGVGFAGTISSMEKDFRALLKEPDAVGKCQKLLTEATPEGQMYSLLGLKLKDETAFRAALSKYQTSKQKVQQLSGCIMHPAAVSELAAEFEKGSYK